MSTTRKAPEDVRTEGGGRVDPEKFNSFTEAVIERMAQEEAEEELFPRDLKPVRIARPPESVSFARICDSGAPQVEIDRRESQRIGIAEATEGRLLPYLPARALVREPPEWHDADSQPPWRAARDSPAAQISSTERSSIPLASPSSTSSRNLAVER